ISSGPHRLAQRIRVGLETPTTTWRWDLRKGFPVLRVEKLTPAILSALLRRFLLAFPEVASVRSLAIRPLQPGVAEADYVVISSAGETVQDTVHFAVINR